MKPPRRVLPALALAAPLYAHEGKLTGPHDLWTAWEFDPLVVIALGASAFLFARGARRPRGSRAWEQWSFWAGWFTAAVALVSPLHPLGEVLFSAHMVQHEILMTLSAPLLVLGRPLAPSIRGLPERWRQPVGRFVLRGWPAAFGARLAAPAVAWTLHLAALWVWHVPVLFEATLTSDFVHGLQHFSFFFSALVFWWALIRGQGRANFGIGVFYLFATVLHTGLLGAFLTFSQRLWYPLYAASTEPWGLTPLEDQQLGGLIMWIPACMVYVVAGVVLMGAWLRQSERGLPVRTAR